MSSEKKQLSMAASAIALKGVRLFLNATRAAAERRTPTEAPRRKLAKPTTVAAKLSVKTIERLMRGTRFQKPELEALYSMYRRLVTTAQMAAPVSIGQPPATIDGIDVGTFRDVLHSTLELVTEELVLQRVWVSWERPGGGEGPLTYDAWARGLSVLLRGTDEERMNFCFCVYDLNGDGFITKDEMFALLKNCLLKQPGDEDPDEGVRELVELVLRKMDHDKDGRVSLEDYKLSVKQEPLLLEAFGQCLPSKRHATAFLNTLTSLK